jgi:hypothetical protein
MVDRGMHYTDADGPTLQMPGSGWLGQNQSPSCEEFKMAKTMVSILGEALHSISFGRLAYCTLREKVQLDKGLPTASFESVE